MALATTPLYMQAENVDIKRIEIEKDKSVEVEYCYGIGEQGLILTTKEDDKQNGTAKGYDRYTFTKYDTLLNKISSVDAEVNPGSSRLIGSTYRYSNSFAKDNNLYYINEEKSGDYEILVVDGKSMKTKALSGNIGKKSDVRYCRVMGDYVYMVGSLKDLPFVYTVDLKTGAGKMINIPVSNKKHYSFVSFEEDDEQNEVHLFIKERQDKKYVMKFHVFTDGNYTNEITLTPDEEGKCPATAFATKMEDGSYIISGTYSKHDDELLTNTIGVFFKKVENENTVYSTYVNYLDLNNFTSYMPERKQKKIEKKKAKKEEKGDEYTINYNMLPYRVIKENDKYLLVGEAYYPTYVMKSHTILVSNGNGGTTPQTIYHQEFDGYAYSHYFVVEFDQQGKMEWSNSAPLHILKSWIPRRHLSLNKDAEALEVFFPSFGHMHHISYNFNGDELKKEEVAYVDDDVTLKRYAGLSTGYWYKGTFLSTGYLKVKDDDGKRKIYSINRIKYGK